MVKVPGFSYEATVASTGRDGNAHACYYGIVLQDELRLDCIVTARFAASFSITALLCESRLRRPMMKLRESRLSLVLLVTSCYHVSGTFQLYLISRIVVGFAEI